MTMRLLLVLVAVLMFSTSSYAADEYDAEEEMTSVLDHWYAEVCPFGTAYVTDMAKSVIASVACVSYDYKSRKYVTWNGAVNAKRNFKYYEPTKVRIFVVDGELILGKDGFPKVVEYGAMTITDPRFPEWIKTH